MLVHSVYFWLRKGLSEAECRDFRAGLESLRGISDVRTLHVGTPAETPRRPVLVADYDFAIVVVLDNLDAHDAYQNAPLHQAFLKQYAAFWTRVQIFDFS